MPRRPIEPAAESRWMTWADWCRQAHERPRPREALDELQHLEQYVRDARAHGVEPEKFLAMIEAERAKGYARDEARQRVLRRLRRRRGGVRRGTARSG
jgi:hypothetical protein